MRHSHSTASYTTSTQLGNHSLRSSYSSTPSPLRSHSIALRIIASIYQAPPTHTPYTHTSQNHNTPHISTSSQPQTIHCIPHEAGSDSSSRRTGTSSDVRILFDGGIEEPSALLFLRGCSWFTPVHRPLLVLIDATVLVYPWGWGFCSLGLVASLLISAVYHSRCSPSPTRSNRFSRSCALAQHLVPRNATDSRTIRLGLFTNGTLAATPLLLTMQKTYFE